MGVLPTDESKVIMKGRLGPGMMISVDLTSGQVLGFCYDSLFLLNNCASPLFFCSLMIYIKKCPAKKQINRCYSHNHVPFLIFNILFPLRRYLKILRLKSELHYLIPMGNG